LGPNPPVSTRIDPDIHNPPVPTDPHESRFASGIEPETTRRESLVVVQAVAGSSPAAHLNPCKSGSSGLRAM
jgi:hypothetical protein